MNRSAELQLGVVPRAPIAPTWRSALLSRGSWSQCMRKNGRGPSMNQRWFGVPPSGGAISSGRLKPGLQTASGSWPRCMRKSERGLSMNHVAVDVSPLTLH